MKLQIELNDKTGIKLESRNRVMELTIDSGKNYHYTSLSKQEASIILEAIKGFLIECDNSTEPN